LQGYRDNQKNCAAPANGRATRENAVFRLPDCTGCSLAAIFMYWIHQIYQTPKSSAQMKRIFSCFRVRIV
jgi:hypothetical protein